MRLLLLILLAASVASAQSHTVFYKYHIPGSVSFISKDTVAADADDAVFVDGDEKDSWYGGSDGTMIYYGDIQGGTEQGIMALRFLPEIPGTATIDSAFVYVRTQNYYALSTLPQSVSIFVYDTVDVAAFADAHSHSYDVHATVLTTDSVAWSQGSVNASFTTFQSPDLKDLVQHVVDKASFGTSSHIGFIFRPQTNIVYRCTDFFEYSTDSGNYTAVLWVYYTVQ